MTIGAVVSKLLEEDALDQAIDAAKAHVKTTPADHHGRNLYIDLLILAGDYEKADNQCSLAATFSPEQSTGYSVLRHQLRAMAARDAWFSSGALPDFPGGPSALDQLAVKAAIALKSGEVDAAAEALAALDEQRGQVPATINGTLADDVRDLDDRIPHALEVLTTGGRYLWIDFARIQTLAIEPMARPRDLAFRQAEIALHDGAVASVLLPALYHAGRENTALTLGRETSWDDSRTGIVTGAGQRCLLVGDELVAFHEIVDWQGAADNSERHSARG